MVLHQPHPPEFDIKLTLYRLALRDNVTFIEIVNTLPESFPILLMRQEEPKHERMRVQSAAGQ